MRMRQYVLFRFGFWIFCFCSDAFSLSLTSLTHNNKQATKLYETEDIFILKIKFQENMNKEKLLLSLLNKLDNSGLSANKEKEDYTRAVIPTTNHEHYVTTNIKMIQSPLVRDSCFIIHLFTINSCYLIMY